MLFFFVFEESKFNNLIHLKGTTETETEITDQTDSEAEKSKKAESTEKEEQETIEEEIDNK